MSVDARQLWPAAERNKQPILEVLTRVVPKRARVLEIASGTGQHAAHFAAHLDVERWQPSDPDVEHHASIRAWTAELAHVAPPLALDTTLDRWPLDGAQLDVIYSANMIHIAPFAACEGLLRGAGAHLVGGGKLVLYGPFKLDGAHTAESNARFDDSLRQRDPRWGVRDLTTVRELAEGHELVFSERIEMPANNQLVVFQKR